VVAGVVVVLGDVVVLRGVVVPLLGTQLTVIPLAAVGAAAAALTLPTCEGAGVTAVGCGALGVGETAVVVRVPVELDCGMVPAGQGVDPLAPRPPTVAPGVVLAVPGEMPGSAVLFVPGVVVCVPGDVPGIAVLFMPGVTPGVVVCVPVVVPIVVPGVVWPAAAGVGDVEVWPAVAGAVVPVPLAVPTVCATAHVPASSKVKKSNFRMQNSSAARTDGCSLFVVLLSSMAGRAKTDVRKSGSSGGQSLTTGARNTG